jgi:hypothetical protein
MPCDGRNGIFGFIGGFSLISWDFLGINVSRKRQVSIAGMLYAQECNCGIPDVS